MANRVPLDRTLEIIDMWNIGGPDRKQSQEEAPVRTDVPAVRENDGVTVQQNMESLKQLESMLAGTR